MTLKLPNDGDVGRNEEAKLSRPSLMIAPYPAAAPQIDEEVAPDRCGCARKLRPCSNGKW